MESPIIQQSTEYNRFKRILGNRQLNQKKIKNLVADRARLLFVGPEAEENLLDAVEKFLPQYKQSRTF